MQSSHDRVALIKNWERALEAENKSDRPPTKPALMRSGAGWLAQESLGYVQMQRFGTA